MVRKTLNKYRWHPELDFSKVCVYYVDRLDPKGYRILKGSDIVDLGDKFIFTREGMIPYHRVIKIEYNGEIIWRRLHSD